ncbi:LacI family transcriptional regulator [Planosporangium thailandense]|uniref:LacI family transcriptional regulator n=1 Tax=Planosporangium thailandense TaxID=765197 RepID=A0ABX0Y7L8_9ACTN|nr:LacI family DNA-binding transcriptional regulator [Planosporangium thailandense]NJC73430.1 LacI family transcriptional regulator [Planosporangium thailandense]
MPNKKNARTRHTSVSQRRQVTIIEVAEAAGVSIATVSRVMSGSPSVRSELVERVRRAADELGYRPNPAAQRLASGVGDTIGVVVPNLANPYFYDVIKAMNIAAATEGYQMLIADANEDPDEEFDLSTNLLRQVDGLVLVSPRMPAASLRRLAQENVHIVLVNRVAVGVGLPTVAVDNYSAMVEICGHLARLGHRRVVYLAGPELSWQNVERQRAVEQAEAFGLEVQTVPAGASIDTGHAAVDRALELKPTALVSFNDLVAFGALARLQELGVRVPDDVSLTGFDDIPFAAYVSPSLTTANSPQRVLGQRAWQVLHQMMSGAEVDDTPLVKAEVVIRGSTAAPTSSTPDRLPSRPAAGSAAPSVH